MNVVHDDMIDEVGGGTHGSRRVIVEEGCQY